MGESTAGHQKWQRVTRGTVHSSTYNLCNNTTKYFQVLNNITQHLAYFYIQCMRLDKIPHGPIWMTFKSFSSISDYMNLCQADTKTRAQKTPVIHASIIHVSIYLHFHFSVIMRINVLCAATVEAAAHFAWLAASFWLSHVACYSFSNVLHIYSTHWCSGDFQEHNLYV